METIFNELINYGESSVRIVGTNDNPYFCGSEICKILGYKSAKMALHTHVKPKYKKTLSGLTNEVVSESLTTSFNEGKAIYISEPGLYALISKCSLPVAEKFQDWIHEEVLPTIRKKGEYKLQKELEESMAILEENAKVIEDLKLRTLGLTNFVTNVKIREKREFIYIVSTRQYAANNNFKVGHTDNLKQRLSQYNTGHASTDNFYYCYKKQIFEGQKCDKMIHDLLTDFKEVKNKENIIMHFKYLRDIVDFVSENFNENYEFLNDFIRNKLVNSYALRPEIPDPVEIDDSTLREDLRIFIEKMTYEEMKKLLLEIVGKCDGTALTRNFIIDYLKENNYVVTSKRKLWDVLKDIMKEKNIVVPYARK